VGAQAATDADPLGHLPGYVRVAADHVAHGVGPGGARAPGGVGPAGAVALLQTIERGAVAEPQLAGALSEVGGEAGAARAPVGQDRLRALQREARHEVAERE